jgi:hypothetical protein
MAPAPIRGCGTGLAAAGSRSWWTTSTSALASTWHPPGVADLEAEPPDDAFTKTVKHIAN